MPYYNKTTGTKLGMFHLALIKAGLKSYSHIKGGLKPGNHYSISLYHHTLLTRG